MKDHERDALWAIVQEDMFGQENLQNVEHNDGDTAEARQQDALLAQRLLRMMSDDELSPEFVAATVH